MRYILLCFLMVFEATAIAGVNLNEVGGYKTIKQHGYVVDSDVNDDVWLGDGAYSFLTTHDSVVVKSSSANDTSSGSGCKTVILEGLDSSYNYQSETVTMNGTSDVLAANSYLRMNNAYCSTVGDGGVNAGQIAVFGITTTSTLQSLIPASAGKAKNAIYTAPADKQSFLASWNSSVSATSTAVGLQMRETGKSWQDIEYGTVDMDGNLFHKTSESWLLIPKKADIKLRVIGIGADSIRTDATMEIIQKQ